MGVRRTSGYSLLEVLVAMLILSAGMVGAAALQLSAWQLTRQSTLHSNAQHLAAEMAEWLYLINQETLQELTDASLSQFGMAAGNPAHCYGSHCATDDFLAFVMSEWMERARSLLPDPQVTICRDALPWDDSLEGFSWECDEDGDAPLAIKLGWRDRQALDRPLSPVVVLSVGR
jgi:type IV pilus assembly protein PilV